MSRRAKVKLSAHLKSLLAKVIIIIALRRLSFMRFHAPPSPPAVRFHQPGKASPCWRQKFILIEIYIWVHFASACGMRDWPTDGQITVDQDQDYRSHDDVWLKTSKTKSQRPNCRTQVCEPNVFQSANYRDCTRLWSSCRGGRDRLAVHSVTLFQSLIYIYFFSSSIHVVVVVIGFFFAFTLFVCLSCALASWVWARWHYEGIAVAIHYLTKNYQCSAEQRLDKSRLHSCCVWLVLSPLPFRTRRSKSSGTQRAPCASSVKNSVCVAFDVFDHAPHNRRVRATSCFVTVSVGRLSLSRNEIQYQRTIINSRKTRQLLRRRFRMCSPGWC